ncbi:polymeric immunoglobulin receptor isoform X6 [Carassius gibelio]|uniref:polymeric immunoglobulin receptor isoform X5 n=1 Tax=Carassius gibelio TaxID=101364 RepID=UPI00227749BA|nr:polymeric immunoglobulin receptor isoform X5 [Carassius gibelio]XP_052404920.1 polymeric immunoglobulin receptor isoform X6 [Carassius gibelio]
MNAYVKTNTFYISIWFWLILGVESYSGWSNHVLTIYPGGSLTIPCYYDKKYTQQKKSWFSEIDKTHTYTNTTEQNLSVIDHPDQSLFTVTMRNLQNKHSGGYYCVVETGEKTSNTIYKPYLKIQSTPDVSLMNSSVSGHEGGDISVQCLYSSGYQNKVKRWCRYKDQRCYTVGRTDTSQNPSVLISDDDGGRSFTVLMTGLRRTDSGWYFCSAGEALNPVHITVTEAEPGIVNDKDFCRNETKDTEEPQNNGLLIVWLLPALAALLLFLILVGVFTWRWRRRPKQDKPHIRGRNSSRTTDMTFSKHEDPVIYSTINDEIPHDPINDMIYYSTIDDVPGSEVMKSPSGEAIYSIIYCTVGPH